MTNEIKVTSKNELSADINVITAEIKVDLQGISDAIFRVGERLVHVRKNEMEKQKGGWDAYCTKELGISRDYANRFIRVYERFGSGDPGRQLPNSLTVLYELTSFTDEELEQTYELPNGESKKPVDMSRREIEVLKKQLKAEQQERERLERENADLAAQSKEIEQVYPDDYEKIKRENAEYRAKYGDSEGVRNIDDKKREKVYEEFANELERLRLKYASVALDGANVDLYASANPEYANKINSFNDFWKMYVKTVSNDQIIIEVESV